MVRAEPEWRRGHDPSAPPSQAPCHQNNLIISIAYKKTAALWGPPRRVLSAAIRQILPGNKLSFRGAGIRPRTRNPAAGSAIVSGFRVRRTQAGYSRPERMPISGKPEIGAPSRNDDVMAQDDEDAPSGTNFIATPFMQ